MKARRAVAVFIAMTTVGGCTSSVTIAHHASTTVSASHTSSSPMSTSSPKPTSSAASSSPRRSTSSSRTPSLSAPRSGYAAPPVVGQEILGHDRVVAYYGAPGSDALGVLGKGTPEQAAQAIIRRAGGFVGFGRPVLPAMELIATVARNSPGPDRAYSAPIPLSEVRAYLAVAHEHHMLLILDLQPGRASFLSQTEALAPVLADPSVGLALDPEWQVGPHGKPGNGLIGHSSAAGINAATAWLSHFVQTRRLPDKLVVVHEFTLSMLPDRQHITQHPGIEMVLHADGFGHPATKVRVLRDLRFPSPPFGIGFKLFLKQDSRLMSPAEVMRLHPRPDVITYE